MNKLVQTDSTGSGVFDRIPERRHPWLPPTAAGSRRSGISAATARCADAARSHSTSADGRSKSTQARSRRQRLDPIFTTASIIAVRGRRQLGDDPDRPQPRQLLLREPELSPRSAPTAGLSKGVSSDLDGNGTIDLIASDVTVINADGSKTETVTDRNADGSLRDQRHQHAARRRRPVARNMQADTDGDSVVDRLETITVAADGSSVDTVTVKNADGSVRGGTVSSVSADGLSTTTRQDLTGSGTFDRVHSDSIEVNADGSRTETVIDTSANGTVLGQTVTTTSADGLSRHHPQRLSWRQLRPHRRQQPQRRRQQDRDGDRPQCRRLAARPQRHHPERRPSRRFDHGRRQWRRPDRPHTTTHAVSVAGVAAATVSDFVMPTARCATAPSPPPAPTACR